MSRPNDINDASKTLRNFFMPELFVNVPTAMDICIGSGDVCTTVDTSGSGSQLLWAVVAPLKMMQQHWSSVTEVVQDGVAYGRDGYQGIGDAYEASTMVYSLQRVSGGSVMTSSADALKAGINAFWTHVNPQLNPES